MHLLLLLFRIHMLFVLSIFLPLNCFQAVNKLTLRSIQFKPLGFIIIVISIGAGARLATIHLCFVVVCVFVTVLCCAGHANTLWPTQLAWP